LHFHRLVLRKGKKRMEGRKKGRKKKKKEKGRKKGEKREKKGRNSNLDNPNGFSEFVVDYENIRTNGGNIGFLA